MKRISTCLLGLMLAFSPCVMAYKVQPMVAELSPVGKNSQMQMRIDNTGPNPLTVELVPLHLSMDTQGKETLTPADDELLVIPVTAVIEPGRSQSVVVRYLGDPSITRSRAYRISIRQVKVALREMDHGANLGLLLRFDTLLNVRPKNTQPKLSINQLTRQGDHWLIDVANHGDSYGRLSRTTWHITDSNHSVTLPGKTVGKLLEGSLVLPQSHRIFSMQPPQGFTAETGDIRIEISRDEH